jgi:hypothetical protein
MAVLFLSHARTPEELRDEVCADLRRRIFFLDLRAKNKNSAERARIACATGELSDMLDMWLGLKLDHPIRKRSKVE